MDVGYLWGFLLHGLLQNAENELHIHALAHQRRPDQ